MDIKPQFRVGEKISFDYTFTSDKAEQVNYVVSVNCPDAPRPLLEVKNTQLDKDTPFKEEYVYLDVTEDIDPQNCIAIASIIEPSEITEEKEFEIVTKPSFEVNLLFCKDQSCTKKSKTFLKNEEVSLDYKSDVENVVVEAILTSPTKTEKQLTLPTSIATDQIGTYELEMTASREGYKTITKKEQFAVIEKEAEIQVVSICNVNGVCDGNENSQNCPQDCPISVEKGAEKIIKKPKSYNLYFILGGIILVLIIIYLILRFRQRPKTMGRIFKSN